VDASSNQPSPPRLLAQLAVVAGTIVVPIVLITLVGERLPPPVAQILSLAILPTAALTCWVVLRPDGLGFGGLGLARPPSWLKAVGVGVAVGATVLAASQLFISPLVVLLFGHYLDPAMFDPLAGNVGALATNLSIALFHAALCEEIIFRGFLLQRCERLFRSTGGGTIAAIAVQAVLFGLLHYPQGGAGILATALGGLLWGAAFVVFSRSLWVVIVGHAAFDATFFVLMFLGQHRLLLPG